MYVIFIVKVKITVQRAFSGFNYSTRDKITPHHLFAFSSLRNVNLFSLETLLSIFKLYFFGLVSNSSIFSSILIVILYAFAYLRLSTLLTFMGYSFGCFIQFDCSITRFFSTWILILIFGFFDDLLSQLKIMSTLIISIMALTDF